LFLADIDNISNVKGNNQRSLRYSPRQEEKQDNKSVTTANYMISITALVITAPDIPELIAWPCFLSVLVLEPDHASVQLRETLQFQLQSSK